MVFETDLVWDKRVHRYALTFRSQVTEEAFLENRKQALIQILHRANWMCLCLTLAAAGFLVQHVMARPLTPDAQQHHDSIFLHRLIANILGLCVCVAGILVTWRSSWLEGVSTRRLELYSVLELVLTIFIVLHLDPYYAGQFQGLCTEEISSALGDTDMYYSDSRVLLCWATMTVIAHVHLPIRWCSLVWMEIAVVLSYLVCIALGSPEGPFNVAMNWVNLFALTLSVALWKRHVEYLERLSMLALISEKTLRFQSNFQLEQITSQRESAAVADMGDNSNSNSNSNNNYNDNDKILRFQSDFQLEQITSKGVAAAAADMGDNSNSNNNDDNASMASSIALMSHLVFEIPRRHTEAKLETRALQFLAMAKMGELEHWLIQADQLQCFPEQLLGRGSFGVVVAGEFLGAPVAAKLSFSQHTVSSLRALSSELRIFRRLRHPNIVMFQGACIIPDSELLILVEEIVLGGSLQQFIEAHHAELSNNSNNNNDNKDSSSSSRSNNNHNSDNNKNGVRQLHGIVLGICRALQYLHGLRPAVVHGDLKPCNVLVDRASLTPKLIDFGLSRLQSTKSRAVGGTLRYMAPEVVNHVSDRCNATPSDMFSFGRVAFFVVTGIIPLTDITSGEIIELAQSGAVPSLEWPTERVTWQSGWQDLCEKCLLVNPQDRASAEKTQGLLHSWTDHNNNKTQGTESHPESGSKSPGRSSLVDAVHQAQEMYCKEGDGTHKTTTTTQVAETTMATTAHKMVLWV
ncbi:unnamed protein product [Polarella glacialis]|uniref:Protein kinase domain-containing protein n=1 Tax=Polarella glacialis TaxID=89957 RepID=A0A813I4H5_POLGL|nr:unnamed protein product [Polarella glacialis]